MVDEGANAASHFGASWIGERSCWHCLARSYRWNPDGRHQAQKQTSSREVQGALRWPNMGLRDGSSEGWAQNGLFSPAGVADWSWRNGAGGQDKPGCSATSTIHPGVDSAKES